MPELNEHQRREHVSDQMERIFQALEAIAQLRLSGRAWGEVKVVTIWRDGLIEEFRIDQGDVIRCPALPVQPETQGHSRNGRERKS